MNIYITTIKHSVKQLIQKGAVHVLLGNFAIKFVSLFGSIFIVRFLTKQEYGTLSYIENLYSYATIFIGLGLASASLRYGIIAETKEEKFSVYGFVIRTQTIFNIGLMLALWCFAFLYSHPTKYSDASRLFVILGLALPFQDIASSNLCYERVMLANQRYVKFSIFAAVTSVVFRVIGAKIGGIEGTIWLRVAAEILCCGVIFYCVRQRYFKNEKRTSLEREKKIEILGYSVQNMITNGVWILFMITDVFLIGRLLNDPTALADYKVAYVFPSNMAIITSSIGVFITPYFVKNEKDFSWVRKNYVKVMMANLCLIGGLTIFFIIFARPLILLVYGEQYLNIIPLMRYLLIAHFLNAGFKSLSAGLLAAMGFAKENMIISFMGFFIQVVMALIIIPKYGTIGLAIGNIFTYGFMAGLLIIVFTKKFGFCGQK